MSIKTVSREELLKTDPNEVARLLGIEIQQRMVAGFHLLGEPGGENYSSAKVAEENIRRWFRGTGISDPAADSPAIIETKHEG